MHITLNVPEDLVQALQYLAIQKRLSVEEAAVVELRGLLNSAPARQGSDPQTILQALRNSTAVTAEDVAELNAAIAAGRRPATSGEVFAE